MQREEYGFGTLDIGDHIIVGEIKEGTDVQFEIVSRIIEVANDRFNGEPWGYISNRIHSFSTQPMLYKEISKIKHNMVAFAVVAGRNMTIKTAQYEKAFAGTEYQFKYFYNMDDAVFWIKGILNSK